MKKIKFLIFASLFFTTINSSFANTFIEKKINGYKVKVIKYNLSSKDYTFKIGINNDNEATSLRELMESYNGVSAVNGVYFCPADYSACHGKNFTINERYVEGKKIAGYESTGDRIVFALDIENKPFLFQTNKINKDKEGEIYNGFGNFPLILKDGKGMIENYRDLGLIDKKMKASMSRNFICSDKEKKNLYFGYVYDIELDILNGVLLELGCYDAINLDAGASSAMIYNSRYIIGPRRKILDGIIIERNGLNTRLIREKAEKIMNKIKTAIKQKDILWQKDFLKRLSDVLRKVRAKIYEKNSKDLYEKNGEKNGYIIEIKSIKTLEKIYLINYLEKLNYEEKLKLLK